MNFTNYCHSYVMISFYLHRFERDNVPLFFYICPENKD